MGMGEDNSEDDRADLRVSDVSVWVFWKRVAGETMMMGVRTLGCIA